MRRKASKRGKEGRNSVARIPFKPELISPIKSPVACPPYRSKSRATIPPSIQIPGTCGEHVLMSPWRGHDRQSPRKRNPDNRDSGTVCSILFFNLLSSTCCRCRCFAVRRFLFPSILLSIKAPSIWRTSRQLTTFSARPRAKRTKKEKIMALTEFPDAFSGETLDDSEKMA